jgi:hypothetical protein
VARAPVALHTQEPDPTCTLLSPVRIHTLNLKRSDFTRISPISAPPHLCSGDADAVAGGGGGGGVQARRTYTMLLDEKLQVAPPSCCCANHAFSAMLASRTNNTA